MAFLNLTKSSKTSSENANKICTRKKKKVIGEEYLIRYNIGLSNKNMRRGIQRVRLNLKAIDSNVMMLVGMIPQTILEQGSISNEKN